MSRFFLVIILVLNGLLLATARADTFKLITGETVVGDILPSTANDLGIQVKVGEGEFQKVAWGSFSQEDLKKFATNLKLVSFVEPFIEITRQERTKQTEAPIKPVPHLDLPPHQTLVGALFSSGLGMVIVLLFYAANIYAGYEVAACRGRPRNLVCAVSAVLPFIGPVIFLALPTQLVSGGAPEEEEIEEHPQPKLPPQAVAAAGAKAAPAAAAPAPVVPSVMAPTAPAQPSAPPQFTPPPRRDTPQKLALPQQPGATSATTAGEQALPLDDTSHFIRKDQPKPILFQRGQFTFNRRFFETKFAGFMGVTPKEAERGMVLQIKSLRGEFTGSRISHLTASELSLQVEVEQASKEILIPFQEIREIVLKPKEG